MKNRVYLKRQYGCLECSRCYFKYNHINCTKYDGVNGCVDGGYILVQVPEGYK